MNVTVAAAIILLAVALYTDMRYLIIPNWLTVPFLAGGFVYHGITDGWTGMKYAAYGAAAGFIPLLLLHIAKGIGAGDVKLFAALGAWVGTLAIMQLMMYAILYAGLIGVILMLVSRPFANRMVLSVISLFFQSKDRIWKEGPIWTAAGTTFPFMLAVVPGAVTAWMVI